MKIDDKKTKKVVCKIIKMLEDERLSPDEGITAIANALGLAIAAIEETFPETKKDRKNTFKEVVMAANAIANSVVLHIDGEGPATINVNGEA